jgi:hypothetical protein
MWIKLDFTPLFLGGLLVGLVLVAVGFAVRSSFPQRSFGMFIIVIGAIPVLLCGVPLIMEPIGDMLDKTKRLASIEELPQDRVIQGMRLPRGAKVESTGKLIPRIILAQPATVLGISLEGELKFANTLTTGDRHVATDLETATLSTDQVIDGVPCKAHK